MRVAWNNRNNRLNPKSRKDGSSFKEHAKRMKMFRKSHPCLEVKTAGHNQPMLFESLRTLPVTFIIRETGGSRGTIGTNDSAPIPLWKVALPGCSEN